MKLSVVLPCYNEEENIKRIPNKLIPELLKLGAILGDRVKIGCNSVLEPGTFLGPNTWVLPTTYFKRGYYRRDNNRKNLIKEI